PRPSRAPPRRPPVPGPTSAGPRETWELGPGLQLTAQTGSVSPAPAAARAGARAGDLVIAVAGQPAYTPDELMQAIQKRGGQTFELTLERDGRPQVASVTASSVREKGQGGQETEIGRIGVAIVTKVVRYEAYDPLVA